MNRSKLGLKDEDDIWSDIDWIFDCERDKRDMGALDGCDLSGMTATKRKRTVIDEVAKDIASTLDVGDYSTGSVFVNSDGRVAIVAINLLRGGRVVLTARLEEAEGEEE